MINYCVETKLYPLPMVTCYLDDILIVAPTEQEHNTILEEIMKRLQECGIHLREEKR